jgi:hypothetical protein
MESLIKVGQKSGISSFPEEALCIWCQQVLLLDEQQVLSPFKGAPFLYVNIISILCRRSNSSDGAQEKGKTG